jgi:hypothetical protein
MDYDLTIKICQQFSCHFLPQLLSHYRLHETAKTMREDILHDSHEESLQLALKHFSWAPLNLVYGSCASLLRKKLPGRLKQCRSLHLAASLGFTLIRSLWLNRGIDLRDLRLITRDNFRKLLKDRRDILLG